MVFFPLLSNFPLFLILSLTSITIAFSDLEADRSALLCLRAVVGGRTQLWNTTSPSPCFWEGVTCNSVTNRPTRVISLRLPSDGLVGQLPSNCIGNLTELRDLSLRRNTLSGLIPSDLGSCTELRKLHLEGNRFSGDLPESLFQLKNLVSLNLAGNNFSGELSSGFNNLTKLRNLYLENNQFIGSLPHLDSLVGLLQFNVSFNALNGSIPPKLATFSSQSYLGITSLCGGPLFSCPSNGDDKLSSGAIAGIIVGSLIGFLIVLAVIFLVWRRYKSRKVVLQSESDGPSPMPPTPVKKPENEFRSPTSIITVVEDERLSSSFASNERVKKVVKKSGNDGLVLFGDDMEMFTLQELLRASAEVLGKGTIGTTYKAYLESGAEVIVKRLKNVCLSEKEFARKIEDLGSIVHENLVPLRGFFYGIGEKLLVFEPMPTSLFKVLHGHDRRSLNWETRYKIAIGVANGIKHLHLGGLGITHGNIKSSNILLTEYYDACPSEFGLTQLVSNITSPSLNGYGAPEVRDSRKISKKADVYSYGVVLLELLTGRDPDSVLVEFGVDLPRWAKSVVQENWTIEVFDPELTRFDNFEEQMVQLLNLAISCTAQNPDRRPSMVEITSRIKEICS